MLKNYLLRLTWAICLLALPMLLAAQAKIAYGIKGTVTDESGEPLIGVTVQVAQLRAGTVTDLYGFYEIKGTAPEGNYTLSVSYIGYQTQNIAFSVSPAKADFVQDVKLFEDILSLDEIVVTGNSATATRKQLGNAIGVVDGESIAAAGTINTLGALSGKVQGAIITQNDGNPGGGVSVYLRGPSTINGKSQPLFIVDGVIVDNSSQNVINRNADAMGTNLQAGQNRIVDINPADIERIEVLNGAAAAAQYGSLASNGVVQIFTKRGRIGKPRINFNTSASVSTLRKRLEFNQEPIRFGYPGNERLTTVGDRLTMIADLRDADLRAANPGTGPAALAGRPLVKETYPVTRYDYQDDIFQTALGTANTLSISGGTDKTRYYGSLNYGNNEGIIRNTWFQKYGAKLRIDQTLSSWANLSVGLNYINSKSEDRPNGNNFFSPISTMIIIDNVWDANERDAEGNLQGVELVRMNPLSVIETFEMGQETNRAIGDIQLSLFPIEGLLFKYVMGVDNYSLRGNQFQPRVTYPGVSAAFFPDGYVSIGTDEVFKINHDLNLSYNFNLTKGITSTTTAGAQFLYDRSNFSFAEGRDLLPFIKTLGATGNYFNPAAESRVESSVWGYFLQETFGIQDMLFLTVAGRIDGSSLFGENERNQFYPKASASFVVSELDFWSGEFFKNINTFKLRASYGEAGNLTGIGAYQRFSNYSSNLIAGRSALLRSAALGNPDIRPERQTELEFGADMSFARNRVGLSFSYYTQNITDLLLNRTIASSSGGTSTIANIGEMTNNGIELLVTANPVRSKTFDWNVSLSYNTFNNEVSKIGGGRAGILLRGGGGTQSAIDGQPLGTFFGAQYARNDDGTLLLRTVSTADGDVLLPQIERGNDITGEVMRDANGQPTGDLLRTTLGNPLPDWSGSLINEFKFGKLGFRFQFDALWGFEVWNWNSITSNNVGSSPLSAQELRGEVPRGWVAAIGGFIGPRIQEQHVEDGSFVKLREVGLSYDFGKIGSLEGLTFSISGRNLISFDNYTGYDPETNSAGQNDQVRGDDFGNVPIPMSFQVGLNAAF